MKYIFSLTLFLLFAIINDVSAQWQMQYFDHSQVPDKRNKLKFKNDSTGLLVGEHQIEPDSNFYNVLRTFDAGESWNTVEIGLPVIIRDFQFISDSLIYAAGDYRGIEKGSLGIFLKSTDLGETWDSITSLPLQVNPAISFMNSDTGILAYYDYILRTTDGGTSWDTTWYSRDAGFSFSFFDDVSLNGSVAYVTGRVKKLPIASGEIVGAILKSEDYGRTWDTLRTLDFYPSTIYFINADTGFIGSTIASGKILRTTDGGDTWESSFFGGHIHRITDIHFPSNNVGYAVGYYFPFGQEASSAFFISKTTDGGDTWETFDTVGVSLYSVHFINDTAGYVSGENRLIMKTEGNLKEFPDDYPWAFVNVFAEQHAFAKAQTKVYPNPTNGIIHIESSNSHQIQSVQLISPNGSIINTLENNTNSAPVQMNISRFPAGMYFIRIAYPDKVETLKVLNK